MKITHEDHEEIRNMLKNAIFALNDKYKSCKYTYKELSKMFNISFGMIAFIIRNENWIDNDYNRKI